MGRAAWRWCGPFRAGLAAGALLVLSLAGPARAECEVQTASPWDWNHCWSYQRGTLWLLAVGACWGVCTTLLFRKILGQPVNPPWPRQALWRSVAWFWLLSTAAFFFFFGLLENELWRFAGSLLPPPFNNYWKVSLVLAVGLAGFFFLRSLGRPPHQPRVV
jgi:hypothetical protein